MTPLPSRPGVPVRVALAATTMLLWLVSPALSEAQDAVPVSPREGATLIGARSVVLGWNLPPGSESEAVSVAKRAETSHPGGSFRAPLRDIPLTGPDRAYLLTNLDLGRYYWRVQAAHCTAPPDDTDTARPARATVQPRPSSIWTRSVSGKLASMFEAWSAAKSASS